MAVYNMSIRHVGTILVILVTAIASAQRHQSAFAEQVHFTAERNTVDHPVTVPDGALAVLRKDSGVSAVMDSEAVTSSDILRQWVSASAIHLNGPDEEDFIIIARGPLAGANVTTFWVLRRVAERFELLMTAPAHDLVVKNTRTRGYRDIDILRATAVRSERISLRFNGIRYAEFKDSRK